MNLKNRFFNYFNKSYRLKHFWILSRAKSNCSFVCVAIKENRINVLSEGTAGDLQTPLRRKVHE